LSHTTEQSLDLAIACTRQVTVTMIICGVDVSSTHLDARIGRDGPHQRFARNARGIAELAAFCRAHGVDLVVLEATGGYDRLPFGLLWAEDLPCALANPRAVRRFAEAMGYLEKTDRIDAGVIAQYGAVKRLQPQPPASASQRRLEALTVRLRQLTALRVAQMNQRRLVEDELVLASIDAVIACLTQQVRQLEAAITRLIAADPLWTRLADSFGAIKGVAARTVATLLAHLPEIGTLANKAVAKLIGLAPLADDSGKQKGKRPVRGGRSPVRALLVLIASLVVRHDPDFQAVHQRLIAAGKPRMVARIAIARKLLVRLNAKARDVRADHAKIIAAAA
jgi:transposase